MDVELEGFRKESAVGTWEKKLRGLRWRVHNVTDERSGNITKESICKI
jgi:hypothetical protein